MGQISAWERVSKSEAAPAFTLFSICVKREKN